MTITVQGEKYDDARDLYASIAELEAQADEMTPDLSVTQDLRRHIERLREALPEDFDPSTFTGESDATEASPLPATDAPVELPEEDEPKWEDEPETDDIVCPLCGSVGLLPLQPPQDPTSEKCPACDGVGIVFTGSHVEGHETRNCPTCTGVGYIAREPSIPLPPPPVVANAAPAWEGAQWNANTHRWDEPPASVAPWEGAKWNGITGGYE